MSCWSFHWSYVFTNLVYTTIICCVLLVHLHQRTTFQFIFQSTVSSMCSCDIRANRSVIPVGDYSAQAVINAILSRTFPDDPIVGEEDANDLRQESASALRTRVVDLANSALTTSLIAGEKEEWGIGPKRIRSEEEILNAIDRGTFAGGASGREFSSFFGPARS